VAPATAYDGFQEFCLDSQQEELTQKIGLQFVSWGGSVRQQRWWWNVEKIPSQKTTISVWNKDFEWAHWTCDPSSRNIDYDCVIDDLSELTGFIGDTDPAVRAAGSQPQFAKEVGARLIGNVFGYLQTSKVSIADSPFVNWFQIEEAIAFDRKKVRKLLHSRRVGSIEIKTRNVDVPIDALRKEFKLVGEDSRTLLITRCGKSVIAILARRLPKGLTACQEP
jgi:THUMP domain-like